MTIYSIVLTQAVGRISVTPQRFETVEFRAGAQYIWDSEQRSAILRSTHPDQPTSLIYHDLTPASLFPAIAPLTDPTTGVTQGRYSGPNQIDGVWLYITLSPSELPAGSCKPCSAASLTDQIPGDRWSTLTPGQYTALSLAALTGPHYTHEP